MTPLASHTSIAFAPAPEKVLEELQRRGIHLRNIHQDVWLLFKGV